MIGNYLHRTERERAEIYFGDLDLARVAEIIGTAGVEPGMRDADFRAQHRSFRETVRRKLKRLLELGANVEKGRARYVLKPGMLQEPERQAAFARGLQRTVQFMNECLDHGVVRRGADRKGRRK